MKDLSCEIINIGDELLIGQVLNTNASWMAMELNKNGINVIKIQSIADKAEEIGHSIKSSNADIILLTGGLGPTKDDITKKALTDITKSSLVFHEPTYDHIVKLFGKRNYKVSVVNRLQAFIPMSCTPLYNAHGTAPGMLFDIDNKTVISLPGVPFEMRTLMTDQVIPLITKKFDLNHIFHRTVMTIGVGESMLAEKITDWENNLPSSIKLAYLPQPGIVRLRLSSSGDRSVIDEINNCISELNKIIPDIIFGYDDITIEEVVGQLLIKKGSTMSTAESCTGGYIAHLITSISGSSDYFKGSIVSYSNETKINQLGINPNDIEKHGAVSKEVVEQMAYSGRNVLNSDYCIATSGIAGPTGGTPEKPVGTVWIAVATPNNVISKLIHLGEHRGRNIRRSALLALDLLRNILN